jgi:nicotinamidase-related amidase
MIDLQVDFLAADGRLPVDRDDAQQAIATANAVVDGRTLRGATPVFIVNQFPASARIGNFFRHGAAIAGTPGAALDGRVRRPVEARVMAKSAPSAFTNPELDRWLKAGGVRELYMFGVYAEGCVRATALDARERGYEVTVPVDALGSNAAWKRRYAQWALRRAGVHLVPTLRAPPFAA